MSLVPRVGPSELLFAAEVVRARPREPQPSSWTERHPVAARLEERAPDADLVAELASLEPGDLDDASLLEVVAGWERAVAWAASRQAAAVAEVERRTSGARLEAVADEIAVRLATSRRSAEQLVDRARALAHLPEVHEALATGLLDVRKVDVLVRETRHRTFEDAREILALVLPTAATRTAPQLRSAVRRAEATLDPAALRERHARARRDRCVRITPAPDAMAWVTAFLPATDAMTVVTAVDAVAASAPSEDDRPVDARRADALTDVMRRVLDSGVGPDGPLPVRKTRHPHLQVTVPLADLHAEHGVGELSGYGPIPTVLIHESLHDATVTHVGVDPRTGEVAGPISLPRPGGAPAPGAPPPGGTPPRSTRSGRTRTSSTRTGSTPPGSTRTGSTQTGSTPPGRSGRPAGSVEPEPAERGHRAAVPGEPERPPGPDGPVPPTAHATADSRTVTSTIGGDRPAPVGYRPSAALTRLVVGRDVTCTFPGCRVPASRCDLDHIEPFDDARPAEAQTHADNLHALCRHHHRLKTHHGWTPTRDPRTGITTWTSPLGRRSTRPPTLADPAAGGVSGL